MRILLIVDDETLSLRAIERLLREKFDSVYTAESAQQAEVLLNEHSVTHLLCDRCLTDETMGEVLIDRWKTRFDSIHYAALMTGEDIESIIVPKTVDDIFPKPFDIKLLRESLDRC
jgi:DNA-binding NtrC family response regulator